MVVYHGMVLWWLNYIPRPKGNHVVRVGDACFVFQKWKKLEN